MEEERVLDSTIIEEHFNSLISASEQCTDPFTVEYDDETNVAVRDNSKNAYTNAVNLVQSIEGCINADATNLNRLGQTFFTSDANVSADIESIVNLD